MEDSGNTLNDKLIQWGKNNLLIVGLFLLGLTFLVYGLISFFFSSGSTSQDILFEAKDSSSENISNSPKEKNIAVNLTIDIEGSVVKPGVYHLPLNSRIQDALVAAGGLSEGADRDLIEKTINLATKLSDGAKIYIPKIGESGNSTAIIGSFITQININSGSEQELDSLPGIGPVTVRKIINGRPYSSTDELLSRKILGSKVFEEIKEKISVY